MLTYEENERLTRVGPGTPMGNLMRRHWVAALLSEELVAGGAPKPVRLLGEDFVAFRDKEGRVGLLDAFCPHRGARLTLGRNEDVGLRCIYHGWVLDAAGNVLETPNESDFSRFKDRIKQPACTVAEKGKIIWAYLGPPDEAPPLPDFEWMNVASDQLVVMKYRLDCNWLQAVEGTLDSSHVGFLHADLINYSPQQGVALANGQAAQSVERRPSEDQHPRLDIEETAYGFRYSALRQPSEDPENFVYARTAIWIAPAYSLTAASRGMGMMPFKVPADDNHTVSYLVQWAHDRALNEDRLRFFAGLRTGEDLDGDYNRLRGPENHWLQDREAINRGESYVGIHGVAAQDAAVVESMGPVVDRTREHVGASDAAVARMRRVLLDSLRRFEEDGTVIGAALPDGTLRSLRAWEAVIPKTHSWRDMDRGPTDFTVVPRPAAV